LNSNHKRYVSFITFCYKFAIAERKFVLLSDGQVLLPYMTTLLYLDAMDTYEGEATVVAVTVEGDRQAVVLDQTIMYPQGGGQPCDVGSITSGNLRFVVSDVRNTEGVVYHYGTYVTAGDSLAVGSTVQVSVDSDRRKLHSRIHTAGHVIDMAMRDLGITWLSGKGYHFPAGPYVEYIGQVDQKEVQSFRATLEKACISIIAVDYLCRISYDRGRQKDSMPLRMVTYRDVAIPCGGTHVASLRLVTGFTIRKIKQDGERVRISYQVSSV
jgi:Ser-tRNA(Ala) deacylase AlaX